MIVLGLDTCGAEGSLALVRLSRNTADPPELVDEATLAGRRFAGALIPAIRDMLARQGLVVSSLGAIVVVHGPGSFTGIRIGLGAAKGLSEAAGVPVVAVSRLQVLAGVHGAASAALDAGRGEIYFSDGPEEWLLTADEALSRAAQGELIVCEAQLTAALPAARLVLPPGALAAIRYARPRLLAGGFDNVETLDANYVRPLAYLQSPA